MNFKPTVFVVDDDEALRKSLSRLMESVNLPVETYPDARAFLNNYDPAWRGCLVLDMRMPGMDGLELQEKLIRDGIRIPVIIISAHGNVEKAVRAMKTGAIDFIKKPYKGEVLLERIRYALELDDRIRQREERRAGVEARIARLSPREREIMDQFVAGRSSKQIALDCGLSVKTVSIHRAHIMIKMGVESMTDLVRLVLENKKEAEPILP
ncbi:MAG: response regulator transcription factor [Planctomycetota bacterium]|jgi:FixJ family two-component response regulator